MCVCEPWDLLPGVSGCSGRGLVSVARQQQPSPGRWWWWEGEGEGEVLHEESLSLAPLCPGEGGEGERGGLEGWEIILTLASLLCGSGLIPAAETASPRATLNYM